MSTPFRQVFAAIFCIWTLCLSGVGQGADPPDPAKLKLASAHALVVDLAAGRPVFEKGGDAVTPIASVTKLMTAMVTLDADLPLDEPLTVNGEDVDTLKGTRSRLQIGTALPRREMLRLALMASENRAASALSRHYPGGAAAFVAAMNRKAAQLEMTRTRFSDPTGLSSENVSTANDLVKMVRAAAVYPLIRDFTTQESHSVEVDAAGRIVDFSNSNPLVGDARWQIALSKTGFIREAGRCLVMLAEISSRPTAIVLLDSIGRYTRVADAMRVKYWLETGEALVLPGSAKSKRAHRSTRASYTKPVKASYSKTR